MRILFINRMASLVRGGGETFDIEMARHLSDLGCKCTMLTGLPLIGAPRVDLSGLEVQHIRTPYLGWVPWDQVPGGWRLRMLDFGMFERRAASWASKRDAFDIIQVCELPTFVKCWKDRRKQTPVVMRLTAPDYYDPKGSVSAADAIIASGDTLKSLRAGARLDCHDIPNAVDTDLFTPSNDSTFREDHGLAHDDFIVLSVARFQTVKNHAMLIDAFYRFSKTHERARLVLAGSGPLQGQVLRQCRSLGIESRVLFLGEVPFEKLPGVYAAANVKVISSNYESFCFAALEAMASGLPLIVTATDWVPSLIGHDAGGVVVPIGNAAELAAALSRLSENQETCAVMGKRNRQVAERDHSWENSAARLKKVYERL